MQSLDDFSKGKLDALKARELNRSLATTRRFSPARLRRGGREFISFSCNDYLGLSQHPAVIEAANQAAQRFGAGAGGSRLVTGHHPLAQAFEDRLAAFKNSGHTAASDEVECLTFGSGYLTNLGVIPALVGPRDLIVIDELAHACLFAGGALAGAKVLRFPHNDVGVLAQLLGEARTQYDRCLILTEGVFSMDGDRAPLHELAALARQFDAWLMVDDAHALGVIGTGRGSSCASNVNASNVNASNVDASSVNAGSVDDGEALNIPLQVGTLSKALGSYGGYLCASPTVIELMKSRARTLVYSTGAPPAALAAALAALEIMIAEPERVQRPLMLARRFCAQLGLSEPVSPIVPLIVGGASEALLAMRRLLEAGLLVVAIRPPTVKEGSARLRFTFSAAHSENDIDQACASIQRLHLLPDLAAAL